MNFGLYPGVSAPKIIRGRYDPIFAHRDFNIRGDGQEMEGPVLQRFFDEASGRLAVIEAGLVVVHDGQLYVRDNSHISAYGATIRAHLGGGQDTTGIHLSDKTWAGIGPSNVTLSGLTYDGNATARRAAGSLSGVGQAGAIYCIGTKNVRLRDLVIVDGQGDGIYIGGNSTLNRLSTEFHVENCYTENCGRNGFSIVGAQYGAFINCRSFNHSYGHAHSNISTGFDFEPDSSASVNNAIRVNGCEARYCWAGFVAEVSQGACNNIAWTDTYTEGCNSGWIASGGTSGARIIGARYAANTTNFVNISEKIASFP